MDIDYKPSSLVEELTPIYEIYQNENEFKTFVLSNKLSKVTIKLYDDMDNLKQRVIELPIMSAEILFQLKNCIENNIPLKQKMRDLGVPSSCYERIIHHLISEKIVVFENSEFNICV